MFVQFWESAWAANDFWSSYTFSKEEKPVKDVSPVKEVVNVPIPEVKPVVNEQPKKEVNLSLDDDDDDDFFDDFFDE